MDLQAFGETFVTLLVLMDPVGVAPIFVAVTRGLSPADRRRAAVRAILAAGALVLLFAVFGGFVLEYLNVEVESLSVAGGLLLLLVALEMLRGQDYPEDPEAVGDFALVPLATPLVAGPGAIATAIVLANEHSDTSGTVGVLLGILGALMVTGIVLLLAERLSRSLSAALISFLTRVFGLLLAAIAVQLIVEGVRGLA